jgi:hypothetical protein
MMLYLTNYQYLLSSMVFSGVDKNIGELPKGSKEEDTMSCMPLA